HVSVSPAVSENAGRIVNGAARAGVKIGCPPRKDLKGPLMTEATGGSIKLQFETAVPKGGSTTTSETETRTVICQGCSRPITSTYYDVSGRSTCAECRTRIGSMMETPTGSGPFLMGWPFGIGVGTPGASVLSLL